MALMIKPQLGEKMADFACGTGGFITSWLGQLSGQVTDTTAQKQLDDSIYGIEKKPFPYLLCVTNMLLHDIEVSVTCLDNCPSQEVIKPPVPQAKSAIFSPSFGLIISAMNSVTALGV